MVRRRRIKFHAAAHGSDAILKAGTPRRGAARLGHSLWELMKT